MKTFYVVLAFFLLTGCALSPEQITETAMAASTNTPSATPRPNLTETQIAIPTATQTQAFNADTIATTYAKPTTTAIAKAGAILDEIRIASNDTTNLDLSEAKLVFGPKDDALTHTLNNIVIVDDPRLLVKNFVATIKFINPYDTSTTGQWDYGILFRNKYGNNQYRLIILSNQSWTLYDAESDKYIYSSNDKNINPKAGQENTIWLIVIDAKAHLFINGIYAKTLDVGARLVNGDVSPATGLFYGNLKEKRITEYQDFTVWSLP